MDVIKQLVASIAAGSAHIAVCAVSEHSVGRRM
jgi:hypothetical protein